MTTNQNTNTRTNEDLRDLPLAAAEAAEVSVVVSRPLGTTDTNAKGNEMGSLLALLMGFVIVTAIINGMIWVADKTTNGEC